MLKKNYINLESSIKWCDFFSKKHSDLPYNIKSIFSEFEHTNLNVIGSVGQRH